MLAKSVLGGSCPSFFDSDRHGPLFTNHYTFLFNRTPNVNRIDDSFLRFLVFELAHHLIVIRVAPSTVKTTVRRSEGYQTEASNDDRRMPEVRVCPAAYESLSRSNWWGGDQKERSSHSPTDVGSLTIPRDWRTIATQRPAGRVLSLETDFPQISQTGGFMVKHAASVAIVVLMCLVKSSALSQIPNASFESWTNGDPDGYVTSNINGIVTNVTQSTVAHTGSSAVRGDVVQFFTQVLQPVIQSGPGGHGFGYNQRPGSFTGWYQFTGVGGDRFAVNVGLYQGGINGTIIAIAAAAPSTQVTSYTQITAPFVYQNPGLPDTCIVQVQIVGPSVSVPPHVGSFFLLDDVALVGSAGVEQGTPAVPLAASLEQNYHPRGAAHARPAGQERRARRAAVALRAAQGETRREVLPGARRGRARAGRDVPRHVLPRDRHGRRGVGDASAQGRIGGPPREHAVSAG